MENSLDKKVFAESVRRLRHSPINISALARDLDMPMSSVFHHVKGNRGWRPEEWLTALFKLGAIELKAGGAFIRSRELVKALKRI